MPELAFMILHWPLVRLEEPQIPAFAHEGERAASALFLLVWVASYQLQ